MRTICLHLLLAYAAGSHVSIASRLRSHDGWKRTAPTPDNTPIRFTIFLRQRNLSQLEELFHRVSDPSSPEWGNFIGQTELDALVAPSSEAWRAVEAWLADFQHTKHRTSDSVVVWMAASEAARLFGVEFHRFEQNRSGGPKLHAAHRIHGTASIPAELSPHVAMIGGLTELWHGQRPKAVDRQPPALDATAAAVDLKVTPKLLRKFYNVPEDEVNTAQQNYQAIAAFNDYFSAAALKQFGDANGLPSPDISILGDDCIDHATKPCDGVESDLDVQYITALGQQVKTLFHNMNSSAWVLDFTEAAVRLSPLPKVFSISYGWAELKQCDIAFEQCDTLGYSAAEYVNRTNVGFQKLAVMGVSVLVSDGDDGAQSTSPDGADPIDPARWCGGSPWLCYPKTNSSCSELNLRATSGPNAGKTCPWPVGMSGTGGTLCEWMYLGDLYQDEDIIKLLKGANPSCNLDIFYDGDYGVHLYSECSCDTLAAFQHTGKVGVTSELYVWNASAQMFYADFPTASPYVTSVGATVFKSDDGQSVTAEHAASIIDGAIITTGGGFSNLVDTPHWQQQAVESWSSTPDNTKPPAGSYDPTKRGYPDISLNGHNYQVFLTSDSKSTSCPCKVGGVDGTSASSPALAGLISLVNGHLMNANKTALGFLNPLLYTMHAEEPKAFMDVTYGDNKCTRNYCMLYGFNATKGWDPVAGLGTPDYMKMKEYILKKKAAVLAHK